MLPELAVSGIGIVSSIGHGRDAFTEALLMGKAAFAPMRRPGRQGAGSYLGAEMTDPPAPGAGARGAPRATSLSVQAALAVVDQAWQDARMSDFDRERIGLVVGGSNLQQRELFLAQDAHRGREAFVRPTYALSFMDTDICGFCTAHFGILGVAFTIGGASASGQLAIVQAAQAVASGQVDACIAIGALMDLSHWECQGFRALGAMGSDRFSDAPELACRPFDRDRDGFIYGECSGAIVLESLASCRSRGCAPYALLRGWGVAVDGNRGPDPSLAGEKRAIAQAMSRADLEPADIDYVNPHGTGSTLGDDTELRALRESGLSHARINATKSLVGHGLTAAGAVEAIATLLQMRAGRLHPTRNLDSPIAPEFDWVTTDPVVHRIKHALSLSMGFGGINTALCWSRPA